MASKLAVAIRREAARERLADACAGYAASLGITAPTFTEHRDPMQREVYFVEQVTEFLTRATAAVEKRRR